MAAYYRRPRESGKRVALNFKVPDTLKAGLHLVQRLWRLRAEVEGASDEELKNIDLTYVCNQLLDVGIDGAWEEVASQLDLKISGAPKDDSEWDALRTKLEAKRLAK